MRVVIVDDDKLVCASLKTILEANADITVVALGSDGRHAATIYEQHQPDVLLMDIRMGAVSGLDAAELIMSRNPHARVLFLTTFSDDEYIIRALKMGARGYMLKQSFESIVPALKAVMMGHSVFGEDIVDRIPRILREGSRPDFSSLGINDKEAELIALVAQGLNNKEIAEHLHLGEGTVRNYLSVILEKLHLRDRTQLAVFFYKNR
jgi:DNA-binding NarL/FixJ family response regulator